MAPCPKRENLLRRKKNDLKNRKIYLVIVLALPLIFFFAWNKQYYFDLNPYSGKDYKIVVHADGQTIPISQNKISQKELYGLDSITLRNEEETVHKIQNWEIGIVENKTSFFKMEIKGNQIPKNFFEELKKFPKPAVLYINVNQWSAKEHNPKAENRRIDIF